MQHVFPKIFPARKKISVFCIRETERRTNFCALKLLFRARCAD